MSKVRVYELSKELNISSKLIVEKAKEFGVSVTNLSGVDAGIGGINLETLFQQIKPKNLKQRIHLIILLTKNQRKYSRNQKL